MKTLIASVIAIIIAGGLYVGLVVEKSPVAPPPPPPITWIAMEPTEANARVCASKSIKALLVTIYDASFNLVEARCYPEGNVR